MAELKKVAVVGFGYIGSVIGAVLAERGYKVIGVERDKRIIDAVRAGKSPFNEPGLDALIAKNAADGRLDVGEDPARTAGAEAFVITVGTPLSEDFTPDLRQISAATEAIVPFVKDGTLVVLKSTVPPGTTAEVVAPIIKKKADVLLAFCPERLAEGNAIREFTTIPVVVGGVDERSTKAAAAFWKTALGVEVIEVGDAKSAEMVKLADNLWIDLNIALAGELAKLADKIGIDVLDVIKAANSLPKGSHNVNILLPSVGVGGYCLTKDPWFVHTLGKRNGLDLLIPEASRNVNDGMPGYSAELIDRLLCADGEDRKTKKVAVLGIAFKNNTGDCRYTPTKPVIDELVRLGYRVELCDPWTGPHDEAMVTTLPVSKDIEATLRGADCAAFLAGHREFHDLAIDKVAGLVKPGALVFDGRMFFSRNKINAMKSHGLRYKGVGR